MASDKKVIRQHAFVLHRDDERLGCGLWETDPDWPETRLRCGFYREHHLPDEQAKA